MKWFVSCIIPAKQIGVVQIEAASEEAMRRLAEKLAPCQCEFKSYLFDDFEDDLPVGEFVDAARAKILGY